MSVGVWDPEGENSAGSGSDSGSVDLALLAALLEVIRGQSGSLTERMNEAGLTGHGWIMTCETHVWEISAELSDEDLCDLVRFFTLIEQELSGWEGGKQSPVIPLVKILKSRGQFDADLRKWIKANTDNRYLPYGSAL